MTSNRGEYRTTDEGKDAGVEGVEGIVGVSWVGSSQQD